MLVQASKQHEASIHRDQAGLYQCKLNTFWHVNWDFFELWLVSPLFWVSCKILQTLSDRNHFTRKGMLIGGSNVSLPSKHKEVSVVNEDMWIESACIQIRQLKDVVLIIHC